MSSPYHEASLLWWSPETTEYWPISPTACDSTESPLQELGQVQIWVQEGVGLQGLGGRVGEKGMCGSMKGRGGTRQGGFRRAGRSGQEGRAGQGDPNC